MESHVKKVIGKASKFSAETLKEILNDLNATLEETRATLNSLDYGVIVVNKEGYYKLSNKLALTLFQISEIHHEQKIWQNVKHSELKEFLEIAIKVQWLDGSKDFWINSRLVCCAIKPWVLHGAIKGSVIWIEDITEQRLEMVKMRHIESMARLSTMAETLAHEIKNPLGAISIHLQLLKKCIEPELFAGNLEETYQIISEEIQRLGEVVHNYLDAARPLSMHLSRANLQTIVQESLDLLKVEAQELGINLQLVQSEQVVPDLLLDHRLMKQMIMNLLTNAMQSHATWIKVKIITLSSNIKLLVEDNGDGISKENMSKIFEPHFTTKKNGNGLGLTIVFKIVREHGAYIDVESPLFYEEGRSYGTRFRVDFLRIDADRIQLAAPL